jgi:hypothetical protein
VGYGPKRGRSHRPRQEINANGIEMQGKFEIISFFGYLPLVNGHWFFDFSF